MCKNNSNKNKGDGDMQKSLPKQSEKQSTPQSIHLTNNIADKLAKNKMTINCKDGKAKMDVNHPDYTFWMED